MSLTKDAVASLSLQRKTTKGRRCIKSSQRKMRVILDAAKLKFSFEKGFPLEKSEI